MLVLDLSNVIKILLYDFDQSIMFLIDRKFSRFLGVDSHPNAIKRSMEIYLREERFMTSVQLNAYVTPTRLLMGYGTRVIIKVC